jgi:2-polyprenyl-3-methyl-5-hydroxy-6-metoxy-1,4-benzoquinol methylase
MHVSTLEVEKNVKIHQKIKTMFSTTYDFIVFNDVIRHYINGHSFVIHLFDRSTTNKKTLIC